MYFFRKSHVIKMTKNIKYLRYIYIYTVMFIFVTLIFLNNMMII